MRLHAAEGWCFILLLLLCKAHEAISGCEVIVEASFDIREIHTPLALSYVQEAHVQI